MTKSAAVLEARNAALEAQVAGLQDELALMEKTVAHEFVAKSEYDRKEAVLSSTLTFHRKAKARIAELEHQLGLSPVAASAPASAPAEKPVSAVRAAMEAAKARALAGGDGKVVRA